MRIIRNGVGVNIQATLEIVGVKNVLSLRPSYDSQSVHCLLGTLSMADSNELYFSRIEDKLVISFIEQTRVLQQIGDELHEMEQYSGFSLTRPTLATINTIENHILQITDQSVRLFGINETGVLLDEFSAGENSRITIATANSSQCAISNGEGTLTVLGYKGGKLEQSRYVHQNWIRNCPYGSLTPVQVNEIRQRDRMHPYKSIPTDVW